jgi:hypothetical protein
MPLVARNSRLRSPGSLGGDIGTKARTSQGGSILWTRSESSICPARTDGWAVSHIRAPDEVTIRLAAT